MTELFEIIHNTYDIQATLAFEFNNRCFTRENLVQITQQEFSL